MYYLIRPSFFRVSLSWRNVKRPNLKNKSNLRQIVSSFCVFKDTLKWLSVAPPLSGLCIYRNKPLAFITTPIWFIQYSSLPALPMSTATIVDCYFLTCWYSTWKVPCPCDSLWQTWFSRLLDSFYCTQSLHSHWLEINI